MIPILEPCDQQEAYDMAYEAFRDVRKYELPIINWVLLHVWLIHVLVLKENLKNLKNPFTHSQKSKTIVLLPAIARKPYVDLLNKQAMLVENQKNLF